MHSSGNHAARQSFLAVLNVLERRGAPAGGDGPGLQDEEKIPVHGRAIGLDKRVVR